VDNTSAATHRAILSLSLIGFAAFDLITTIIGAILFEGIFIDLGAFIVIWLAISLSRGSTKAARWLIVFMVYYAVLGVVLGFLCIATPQTMTVGKHRFGTEDLPYAALIIAITGTWAIANLVLLWKHRRLLSTPPSDS